MNVSELIIALQALPPTLPVFTLEKPVNGESEMEELSDVPAVSHYWKFTKTEDFSGHTRHQCIFIGNK